MKFFSRGQKVQNVVGKREKTWQNAKKKFCLIAHSRQTSSASLSKAISKKGRSSHCMPVQLVLAQATGWCFMPPPPFLLGHMLTSVGHCVSTASLVLNFFPSRKSPPPPAPRPWTHPPPDQSNQRGKKRNLQEGKSCRTIFDTQTFGSQIPLPPPPLSTALPTVWYG